MKNLSMGALCFFLCMHRAEKAIHKLFRINDTWLIMSFLLCICATRVASPHPHTQTNGKCLCKGIVPLFLHAARTHNMGKKHVSCFVRLRQRAFALIYIGSFVSICFRLKLSFLWFFGINVFFSTS